MKVVFYRGADNEQRTWLFIINGSIIISDDCFSFFINFLIEKVS